MTAVLLASCAAQEQPEQRPAATVPVAPTPSATPEPGMRLACADAFAPEARFLKRRDWRRTALTLGPVRLLRLREPVRRRPQKGTIAFKVPVLVAPRADATLRVMANRGGGFVALPGVTRLDNVQSASASRVVEIEGCAPLPPDAGARGLRDSAHGTAFVLDGPSCVSFEVRQRDRRFRARVPIGLSKCD